MIIGNQNSDAHLSLPNAKFVVTMWGDCRFSGWMTE